MSTTVTLDRVWLHDAADLSDAVAIRHRPLEGVVAVTGQVRTYAGGRRRLVTRPGRVEPLDVTAVRMSRSTFHWLSDRLGELLMLRDPHGRKLWGCVLDLPVREWPVAGADHLGLELEFTFEPLTYDEAV